MNQRDLAVSAPDAWRRTARSRLRLELASLAFACRRGFRPQEYARHLWGTGAVAWMGQARPTARGYLLREALALSQLYPDVSFSIHEAGDETGEIVFTEGCLAGWGPDRWAMAKSLGLAQQEVCAYCQEAFCAWTEQLGLRASIGPDDDGVCRLRVVKP